MNTQFECHCQRKLFFNRRSWSRSLWAFHGVLISCLCSPAVRGAFQGEGQGPWPGWRAHAPPFGFVLDPLAPAGLAFVQRASGFHFWPPPRPAGRCPLRDISVSFLRDLNMWERGPGALYKFGELCWSRAPPRLTPAVGVPADVPFRVPGLQGATSAQRSPAKCERRVCLLLTS